MRERIEGFLLTMLSSRMGRKAIEAELMPKYKITACSSLSDADKAAIKSVWSSLCTVRDFRSWEFFKAKIGFDPLFIPDDIFVRYIIRVLNPIDKVYCLQNKGMYPYLYSGLNMPVTHANCINGTIYLPGGEIVNRENLCNRLMIGRDLILKPSTDTCSGQGVVRIHTIKELADALATAGDNFVIQDCVEQSELTGRFNKSSLNTFRINTLYINGHVSTVNIMFRHGLNGAVVDNAGAGGVYSGVETDGRFIGRSLDRNLKDYTDTPFGIKYSEVIIPEVSILTEYAENAHKAYLPMMGHVAWDIALDKNNMPVIIEVNLGWPGIMTEQLSSCRPIYGFRTEEVIEYAAGRKHRLSFTDFIGHWT